MNLCIEYGFMHVFKYLAHCVVKLRQFTKLPKNKVIIYFVSGNSTISYDVG